MKTTSSKTKAEQKTKETDEQIQYRFLKTPAGFYKYLRQRIKGSTSRQKAFEEVSDLYLKVFGKRPDYRSYNDFKTKIVKNLQYYTTNFDVR